MHENRSYIVIYTANLLNKIVSLYIKNSRIMFLQYALSIQFKVLQYCSGTWEESSEATEDSSDVPIFLS